MATGWKHVDVPYAVCRWCFQGWVGVHSLACSSRRDRRLEVIGEIFRILRVSPPMLGGVAYASFSWIDSIFLDYSWLVDTPKCGCRLGGYASCRVWSCLLRSKLFTLRKPRNPPVPVLWYFLPPPRPRILPSVLLRFRKQSSFLVLSCAMLFVFSCIS